MTNTSGGRRRDAGASRASGAKAKGRTTSSGGKRDEPGRGRTARAGGASKSTRGARDPGLLPLLGPDDDRPYARARDARQGTARQGTARQGTARQGTARQGTARLGTGAARTGRRPLGDRAQSGVRKRATGSRSTGSDAPDQSRKRPGARDEKRRGGDPARAARREGEVTGPFTRRREAPAPPAEAKRPVLRLSRSGDDRPKAGDRTKKAAGRGKPATTRAPSGRTASARTETPRAGADRGRPKPAPAGGASASRKRARPTEATEELRRLAGGNASRAVETLARASDAFARGRERDALRILRPLTESYPSAVAVRELAGLCRYRIGSYAAAADDLAAFAELSGSTEQHPVLMDCRRAQGKLRDVEELWEELRETSPSAALVTEGRIVVAGALADAGRLAEAIDLLARRSEVPGRTKEHTVRLWYALADLQERAGDVPRARALFEQVQRFDAEFADVAERLAALS